MKRTKSLSCSICKKCFRFQSDLDGHAASHLSYEDRPFVCEEPDCGKRFATSQQRQVHIKVHASERTKFQCVHCEKSFLRERSLLKHTIQTHGDHPPQVEKGESKSPTLSSHHESSQLHQSTSLTSYQPQIFEKKSVQLAHCKECGKSFQTENWLRVHERKHHLHLPPYECSSCAMSFHTPALLKHHRETYHSKNNKNQNHSVLDRNSSVDIAMGDSDESDKQVSKTGKEKKESSVDNGNLSSKLQKSIEVLQDIYHYQFEDQTHQMYDNANRSRRVFDHQQLVSLIMSNKSVRLIDSTELWHNIFPAAPSEPDRGNDFVEVAASNRKRNHHTVQTENSTQMKEGERSSYRRKLGSGQCEMLDVGMQWEDKYNNSSICTETQTSFSNELRIEVGTQCDTSSRSQRCQSTETNNQTETAKDPLESLYFALGSTPTTAQLYGVSVGTHTELWNNSTEQTQLAVSVGTDPMNEPVSIGTDPIDFSQYLTNEAEYEAGKQVSTGTDPIDFSQYLSNEAEMDYETGKQVSTGTDPIDFSQYLSNEAEMDYEIGKQVSTGTDPIDFSQYLSNKAEMDYEIGKQVSTGTDPIDFPISDGAVCYSTKTSEM